MITEGRLSLFQADGAKVDGAGEGPGGAAGGRPGGEGQDQEDGHRPAQGVEGGGGEAQARAGRHQDGESKVGHVCRSSRAWACT